ncbi:hypothetical protein TSAR_005928 [Trichomalopsis sarcophagae]|uniref:Uncharacterized protein n=1 Tax=Trichomalopsis sarcophagae TaxID=543379 RepID=A0A232FDS5_9HYME|nr:hypothetical protein TSAR_005928 [Trichomalopsis sarcophagae]
MLPNQQHIQQEDKASQTIEASNAATTKTLNKRKAMPLSKLEKQQENYAKNTRKVKKGASVEIASKLQLQVSSEGKADPPWQEIITRKEKKKENKRKKEITKITL